MQKYEAERVVQKLFERFALRYARTFLAEFEGLDIEAVKAEWAEEMQHFSVEQVRKAFEGVKYNQYPPSLPTFVAYCKSGPVSTSPALPEKFTPEQLARNKAKVRELIEQLAQGKISQALDTDR